jgi:hypothetical protein
LEKFPIGGNTLSGFYIPDARGQNTRNLTLLKEVIKKRYETMKPELLRLIIEETVCPEGKISFIYDILKGFSSDSDLHPAGASMLHSSSPIESYKELSHHDRELVEDVRLFFDSRIDETRQERSIDDAYSCDFEFGPPVDIFVPNRYLEDALLALRYILIESPWVLSFVDAGYGDARVCALAAKADGFRKVAGSEFNEGLAKQGHRLIKEFLDNNNGNGSIEIDLLYANLRERDYNEFDVIYYYYFHPILSEEDLDHIVSTMKPGAYLVVSPSDLWVCNRDDRLEKRIDIGFCSIYRKKQK